tara:strand:- start:547 stop:2085 length:1539 start_codon:yes stop_codon:yes gene_type:complete
MANTTFSSGELVTANKLNTVNPAIISTGGSVARTLADRATDVVNVLDYGADNTGATSSSTAFTNALAAGDTIFVPEGTYEISGVVLTSQKQVIGASQLNTTLKPTGNSVTMFEVATGTQAFYLRLSNFNVDAGSYTGIKFFNQVTTSLYIAYGVFSDLNINANISYAFKGSFITCKWSNCLIGSSGAPGTKHIAIECEDSSGSPNYGHTHNANKAENCVFYNGRSDVAGDAAGGASVRIINGSVFYFDRCTWESSKIRCVYAESVKNLNFTSCWFEAAGDAYQVHAKTGLWVGATGSQATFNNCKFSLLTAAAAGGSARPSSAVFIFDASSKFRVSDCTFVNGEAGLLMYGGGVSTNNAVFERNTNVGVPASTIEVNEFNEFGTWIPEFRAASGSAGASDTTVTAATFNKVGRLVQARCEVRWADRGSWTGDVQIYGLPFQASTESIGSSAAVKYIELPEYVNFVPRVSASSSYLDLRRTFTDATNEYYAQETYFDNVLNILQISITYETAQ